MVFFQWKGRGEYGRRFTFYTKNSKPEGNQEIVKNIEKEKTRNEKEISTSKNTDKKTNVTEDNGEKNKPVIQTQQMVKKDVPVIEKKSVDAETKTNEIKPEIKPHQNTIVTRTHKDEIITDENNAIALPPINPVQEQQYKETKETPEKVQAALNILDQLSKRTDRLGDEDRDQLFLVVEYLQSLSGDKFDEHGQLFHWTIRLEIFNQPNRSKAARMIDSICNQGLVNKKDRKILESAALEIRQNGIDLLHGSVKNTKKEEPKEEPKEKPKKKPGWVVPLIITTIIVAVVAAGIYFATKKPANDNKKKPATELFNPSRDDGQNQLKNEAVG